YDAQLIDLAKSTANELLDYASTVDDQRAALDAHIGGVLLIAHFESVPRAVQLLDALATFECRSESPFELGMIHRCRAQVLQQAGEIELAEAEYEEVAQIVDKYMLGPAWQSHANNMAVMDMERGRYEKALERLIEIEQYASERHANELLLGTYTNLAICHWETDAYSECTRVAKQLRSIQEEMAVESRRHEAWSMLGLVALHLGNVTEAKNCEREILLWEGATPSWYGDTSYREMFLARLRVAAAPCRWWRAQTASWIDWSCARRGCRRATDRLVGRGALAVARCGVRPPRRPHLEPAMPAPIRCRAGALRPYWTRTQPSGSPPWQSADRSHSVSSRRSIAWCPPALPRCWPSCCWRGRRRRGRCAAW
ncbi:MAG: hypothetical protein P8099_01850, partial [Gemmatimonadota bacterium]